MAKVGFGGVGGVARKLKGGWAGVGGVARKLKNGWGGVGGVARQCFSSGTPLSDLAEGSIVQIMENGSLAEFYIAKHDYESGLNGTGRTLMVRRYAYDQRAWNTSGTNAYASSSINTWLNGTYKSLFSSSVQTAMGSTKFYYTKGNGDTTKTTLSEAVFLLSATELGFSDSTTNAEGSRLPTYSTIRLLLNNAGGDRVNYWTRSPKTDSTQHVKRISSALVLQQWLCTNTTHYCRPCFTLPSTATVADNSGTYTLAI